MSSVKWLLLLASLFISVVMIRLVMSGVNLKEREMVKWSQVATAELAGEKMALFMYPLIAEFKGIAIVGGDDFSRQFYKSFKRIEDGNSRALPVTQVDEVSPQSPIFQLKIQQMKGLDLESAKASCNQGLKQACVAYKSHKKFLKKKRESSPFWINMFRTGKKEAILFVLSQQE